MERKDFTFTKVFLKYVDFIFFAYVGNKAVVVFDTLNFATFTDFYMATAMYAIYAVLDKVRRDYVVAKKGKG